MPIFLQEPVELVPIFLQEPSELVPKEMCVLLLTDPFLFFLLLYVQYLSSNVLAAREYLVKAKTDCSVTSMNCLQHIFFNVAKNMQCPKKEPTIFYVLLSFQICTKNMPASLLHVTQLL